MAGVAVPLAGAAAPSCRVGRRGSRRRVSMSTGRWVLARRISPSEKRASSTACDVEPSLTEDRFGRPRRYQRHARWRQLIRAGRRCVGDTANRSERRLWARISLARGPRRPSFGACDLRGRGARLRRHRTPAMGAGCSVPRAYVIRCGRCQARVDGDIDVDGSVTAAVPPDPSRAAVVSQMAPSLRSAVAVIVSAW
jgi:hypothetical protein